MRFLVIFGPPAVGKTTIGKLIEAATGIRLFHNHMSIEPVLSLFPFGSPAFRRLVDGFRQSVFAEVAASDLPGLCFTFVWDLDNEGDREFLQTACEPFRKQGADITFIELRADLSERLVRNRSPDRQLEKPSKRDLANSEASLLMLDRKRLNTNGFIPLNYHHLVIDTNGRSAQQTVDELLELLGLRQPAT